MVVPGESLPKDETLSSGIPASASKTDSATITSTSSSSPSRTAAAASENPTSSRPHLSSGAIAGIAIGGVVVVGAIGYLLFLLGRHHSEIQFLRRDVHAQRRSLPPEMKHDYSIAGDAQQPSSPFYPYSAEDPRFRDHRGSDVPPYTNYAGPNEAATAELPSPPLGFNRSGSPFSELDTHWKMR